MDANVNKYFKIYVRSGSFYLTGEIGGRLGVGGMVYKSPNENISACHLSDGVYFVSVKEKTMKIIKR